MFTFTPLLGAQSDSRASQSILELDGGVKILVDAGWDDRFDTRQLAELEKHVPTLSFILLTHATIAHVGAFAHCCKHIPLFTQLPIYATSPVIAFGRTLLQDLYSSNPLAATFIPSSTSPTEDTSTDAQNRSSILREAPTFEEINRYFSLITPLKYSQPHQPVASYFSASLEGLTLTAYNAGHTLGGTIWHIQHGMESIVYAMNWHQARENVIAGAAWFGGVGGSEVIEQLRKPTALICSSVNGNKVALNGGRKARDELLLSHIQSSIAKGGTVLIPTDSSARILELAWLLEKTWHEAAVNSPLKNAKLYLASRAAHATLRHARSLLEWMDDSIVREFEGDDDGATVKTHKRSDSKQVNGAAKASRPFDFKHIKIVERETQVDKVFRGEGAKVILASDTSMEWGFSKTFLERASNNAENLIILTERGDAGQNMNPNSVQQKLWQWFEERQDGVALERSTNGEQIEQVHTGGRSIHCHDILVQPLDANETQQYQQYMATQRQVQASLVTSDNRQLVQAEEAMDDEDESSSESDESDDEQQGRALNVSAALGHSSRNKVAISDEDLGVSILLRKKGVYDYDVRNKKGRNAVFPHTHTRKRGDEFGDYIKPEDFLREEEKEERLATEKQAITTGQKRKWDSALESASAPPSKRSHLEGDDASSGGGNADLQDSDFSDDDDNEEPLHTATSSGPSKIVMDERQIQLHARLAFVDFSGLHDQRSLQMLIPLIGPKKLILTGGSSDETLALAADCRELLGMKIDGAEEEVAEIFTPVNKQSIDASVDTNAWVVKLSRDLARRLHWQNVKNMGIVTVTGQLRAEVVDAVSSGGSIQTKKVKLEEADDKPRETSGDTKKSSSLSFEAVLEPVPANLAASTRSTSQPVHVGDLRLADLRRLMNAAGHSAEFRGEGTLLVDSMIAVRKMPNGKIIVEGAPVSSLLRVNARASDSFTQVKRKIYEGLAVVAAG